MRNTLGTSQDQSIFTDFEKNDYSQNFLDKYGIDLNEYTPSMKSQ